MSALYITIILIAAVALMQVAPTLHDLQGDYGISLNNFNFKGRNSIASESFGNSTTNSSTLGPVPGNVTSTLSPVPKNVTSTVPLKNVTSTSTFPKNVTSTSVIQTTSNLTPSARFYCILVVFLTLIYS
ncbi:unnamed protein product [Cylicocyclus nassatus]|uniref:Uncharacterized protein n=1 Tax=Cylicocyclus nassatus TaxID=53992 RepID=A0AA36M865_CYLNA|nr:unnamed protein product [Cylicocyclus nassatus]